MESHLPNSKFARTLGKFAFPTMIEVPITLTIAGSDTSSGAGLQADLKTFQYFGCHGLNAVTCVVAETSSEVRSIHPLPPSGLRDQVDLMLGRYPVRAAKTGMLYSREHVMTVAEALADYPDLMLVIDPVMIASTGDPLIQQEAIDAYREHLIPRATLITPNLDEAAVLADCPRDALREEADLERVAATLHDRFRVAVLVKGGHLEGPECVDLLVTDDGTQWYRSPRQADVASHGTGCTLSAAITAALAHGLTMTDAVAQAKTFLDHALARSLQLGSLTALNHGTDPDFAALPALDG